ncbi:hypothetical protein GCM10011579_049810 [Streptomyces albiflavescens]|uniref:Uncharacterized protein n=1 Tax=Streptomyces albiflavescens TaxID=1623582 RepID=A0A917Y7C1_9ACTN|nr:hypothetical protein GCM10011579_049810 [Streptomyces albiflavescens]
MPEFSGQLMVAFVEREVLSLVRSVACRLQKVCSIVMYVVIGPRFLPSGMWLPWLGDRCTRQVPVTQGWPVNLWMPGQCQAHLSKTTTPYPTPAGMQANKYRNCDGYRPSTSRMTV